MEREYKILVLVIPAYGHLNPMTSFVNELAKTKNVKVVLPGNEVDRQLIESTKAQFMPMHVDVFDKKLNMNQLRHDFPVDKMMEKFMSTGREVLPQLAELVQREHFDLIIYDFATNYGRWLKDHMLMLSKAGKLRCKMPEFVKFSPSFMCAKDVYPNKAEPAMFPFPKLGFFSFFRIILMTIKYFLFCWKYGIKFENPSEFVFHREKLNICGIIPELQPRSYLFDKSLAFAGSCASEELRESKKLEDPLKTFLEPFEPSNPVPLVNLRVDEQFLAKRKTKLIYASFGTLFNEDIKPFLDIIDAFNSLEQSDSSSYRLLVATGDKTFAKFQEMTSKGQYKPNENILLMSKVPQLDVLKRASVFITHSGQGSTNEAIHYGVPMICVPFFGDQPAVAYRVSDELGLGVQLNYDTLSATKVKEALIKVLDDKSYLERVSLFAQISRKYDGPKTATELVIKYLKQIK